MNKMLLEITSLFLIQILLFGNAALAMDDLVCLDDFKSSLSEEYNLSPRLYIDSSIINYMFVRGLPKTVRVDAVQDDLKQKQSLLKRATEYALRKKQEKQGKGIIKQNIVYLLLKRRVDRLEKRSKPFKIKAKQRKKFIKDVKRLNSLLKTKKKLMPAEMAKTYKKQISHLDDAIEAVETYGDWEDLIAIGTKLNKDLSKRGALAKELASLHGGRKPKKFFRKRKSQKKQNQKSGEVISRLQEEIINPVDVEPIETISEVQFVQTNVDEQNISKFEKSPGANRVTLSVRQPVLGIAIEKLIVTFNLGQKDLPHKTALKFQNQIEVLQNSIESMQSGQFPALKQKLRAVESSLLLSIEQHRNDKAAALEEKRIAEKKENNNKQKKHKKQIKKHVKIKKQTKEEDSFSKAVTLSDPQRIKLRSADEVISELQGQKNLLKQIIEAELGHSWELRSFNVRREIQGLIIQVNYSEALGEIEVGSDIVMELKGEYYDLKCDQILNAGSKLILKPANKGRVFLKDFPLDAKDGKFFYIPSTYSKDIQKKVLKEIAMLVRGKDQSTGIKVLDYLLRIKSVPQDIENSQEMKESLFYTEGLDMFQKAAVNLIVKTKFGLILGPFGTGKTSVLLSGAKNIILKNKKAVFIVAPQHKIADDITRKAGECNIPVLRCGNNSNKFDPEIRDKYGRNTPAAQKKFIRRYNELNTGEEDNGCLLVGTDLGASFDWLVQELRNPKSAAFLKDVTLIVDEAALINYPELITAVYMLRPDSLILVGDHVQFSPYKLVSKISKQAMDILEEKISYKVIWRYHNSSFKELIAMPFNKVNLLINYRNPWISVDFLQKWYRGILKLQSISKKRSDIIDSDTFVIEDTSSWDKQFPEEFYPGTHSYCNKTEALWILKRIKYFLAKGYPADDIAIITYYDGQIRLISDFIDADGDISSADAQVLKQNVFTPIRFQGAEKKIILSSLVRSANYNTNNNKNHNGNKSNQLLTAEPEFAKAEALLVLLSRHTGKLSLIGNSATLDILTKYRYKRMNYFYSSLFSYKYKIKAYLDAKDVELAKKAEEDIRDYDFIRSAI